MLAALIDEAERTGRMDPASSMSALRSTLLPHTNTGRPLPRAAPCVAASTRDLAILRRRSSGSGRGRVVAGRAAAVCSYTLSSPKSTTASSARWQARKRKAASKRGRFNRDMNGAAWLKHGTPTSVTTDSHGTTYSASRVQSFYEPGHNTVGWDSLPAAAPGSNSAFLRHTGGGSAWPRGPHHEHQGGQLPPRLPRVRRRDSVGRSDGHMQRMLRCHLLQRRVPGG